jgi:dienelactone hydrolase
MRRALLIGAALVAVSTIGVIAARAEGGKGEAIDYKDGAVQLEGFLYMPKGTPKGGVLVVPEWWGLDDYAKHRAEMLAELGYSAFAVDMYGKGVHTDDAKKATELSTAIKSDRKVMRARINAALEAFKSSKAKPTKIAAIGYCFGGTSCLELARSGADIKGLVSFHGGLDSPDPAAGKNIKCRVLLCHGADDGFVKAEDLAACEDELRKGGVDWVLVKFSGANHSFTNPDADKHKIPGLSYNEKADKRSWKAMEIFFEEIFAP